MRTYTTLGAGKNAKVIATADYGSARTVTTCPADAGQLIAYALIRTDRSMPAALYPPAAAQDGTPVEARRRLLGVFDRAVTAPAVPGADSAWKQADDLVEALAAATRGQSTAVIKAVRAELAGHLDGSDGVLVPAIASTVRSRGRQNLVVSVGTGWVTDRWWADAITSGDLAAREDIFGEVHGHQVLISTMLDELSHDLYQAEPSDPDLSCGWSMKNLFDEADEGDGIDLTVRVDHTLAWVAHHRPGDLATVKNMLQVR